MVRSLFVCLPSCRPLVSRFPHPFQYDIVAILKKQRQPIKDVDIAISGERAPEVPNPWKTIRMTVHLFAEGGKTLDRKKVGGGRRGNRGLGFLTSPGHLLVDFCSVPSFRSARLLPPLGSFRRSAPSAAPSFRRSAPSAAHSFRCPLLSLAALALPVRTSVQARDRKVLRRARDHRARRGDGDHLGHGVSRVIRLARR